MADLAKLVVRLEAQTAKYMSELDRANKRLDRFSRKSESSVRKLGKGIAAGLAIGTAALSRMVFKLVDTGDQLDKLSLRLGTSVENLSRFQYATDLTGVSATTTNTALQRMVRRIDEVAKTGKGEALPALNELGLSAKKLGELTPEQQFLALADSFKEVESQSTRVRLAMKLFDTEGVALVQTMEGGSEAIVKMARESDNLGNTIRTNTAKQAAELKDSMTRLQGASNGASQELLRNLGPQVLHASKALQVILPKAAQVAAASFFHLQGAMFGVAGTFQTVTGRFAGITAKFLDNIPGGEAFSFAFKDIENEALPKADILFGLMNDRFKEGLATLDQTIAIGAPELASIVPDIAQLQGGNGNAGVKEQEKLSKIAAENDKIVSLQDEKFRRLHQGALEAQGKTLQLEEERYAHQQQLLESDLARLESRGLATAEIQEKFQKAERDAATVHQANLTRIDDEGHRARAELRQAQLQVVGDFFGALGNLAQEGSKAQRVLFFAEKAAAFGQAIISMNLAVAKANAAAAPPANAGLIAAARLQGLASIAGIAGATISGARGAGGSVRAGQSVVVGEFGPEVATFGAAGMVTPNHRLGGGMEVNVQLIEDSSRGGEVVNDEDTIRIYVNRIRAELRSEMQQGRGFGRDIETSYNIRRRTA